MPSPKATELLNWLINHPEDAGKINWVNFAKDEPDVNVDVVASDLGVSHLSPRGKELQSRWEELYSTELKSPVYKPSAEIDIDKPGGTQPYMPDPIASVYRKLQKETGMTEFELDNYLGRKGKQQVQAFAGSFAKGASVGFLKPTNAEQYEKEYPVTSTVGELAGAIAPITGIMGGVKAVGIGAKVGAKLLPTLGRAALAEGTAGAIYSGLEQAGQGEYSVKKLAEDAAIWAGFGVGFKGIGKIVTKLKDAKTITRKAKVLKEEFESFGAGKRPLSIYKQQIKEWQGQHIRSGATIIDGEIGKVIPGVGKTRLSSESGSVVNVVHESAKAIKNPDAIHRKLLSESRNRVKGELGQRAISQMEDVRATRYTLAGDWTTQLRSVFGAGARLRGIITPSFGRQLSDALEGEAKVSQNMREMAAKVRQILDNIWQEASDAGVKIKLPNGKYVDIPKQPNYLPRQLKEDISSKIFDDINKAFAKETELALGAAGQSDIAVAKFIDKDIGRRFLLAPETEKAINYLMTNKNMTYGEAVVKLRRFLHNERFNPFGNLEKARTLDLPSEFYERDFFKLFNSYVMGSSRAIAEVKQWGAQREGIADLLTKIGHESPSDYETVRDMYHLSSGLWEKLHPTNRAWKKTAEAYTKFAVGTKIGLGTAIIPNFFQTLYSTMVRVPWRRVASGGWKYVTDSDFRKAVRSCGATVAEAIQSVTGGNVELKSVPMKVLMSPFTYVNRANKALAASAAREWIPALYRDAQGIGRRAEYAQRQLKKVGVNYREELTEETLRKGMFRTASDTQLQPDIFKEPLWFNKPNTRVFALFKRFGYRQFNLVREDVVGELKHGDPMPLLRLAVGGALGGYLTYKAQNLLRKTLRGDKYDDADLALWQQIVNTYAAVGTLGVISDIARIYDDDPGRMKRQLFTNIGRAVAPVIISEPYELFMEKIPNIAGADETLGQAKKEALKLSPIGRMVAYGDKKPHYPKLRRKKLKRF